MIERRQHLRFALEAGQTFGVAGKGVWEHLDRHLPVKARVSGSIDLTHAAFADLGGHFIRAKGGARLQRHDQSRGTSRLSSSNQFRTRTICAVGPVWSSAVALTIKNRPSGARS